MLTKLERIDGSIVHVNLDNILYMEVVPIKKKTKPYLRILFVSGHWLSVKYSDNLKLED